MSDLLGTIRDDAAASVWTAAVKIARSGAVLGLGSDDEEVRLHVKTQARPLPFEVYLWPEDVDYGCDCGLPTPCVHVCASVIALNKGLKVGQALPEASDAFRVKLRYDFTTEGAKLALVRTVVWPDGRTEVLHGTLAESNYLASRGDTQAEALLVTHPGGALDEEKLRRLLVFLEGLPAATLDGKKVRLSDEAIPFVIKARDEGESFRVGIYRPAGLDALYLGAALRKGVLYPTTYGDVPAAERKAMHPRRDDRVFSSDQVSWLVSEYLPRLREYGLPVEITTDRLPRPEALEPRIRVELSTASEGLRVKAVLIYGQPPVARIEEGKMVKLGAVVPVRDIAAERRVARVFEEEARLPIGFERRLAPTDAVDFLHQVLPRLDVEVHGKVDADRFRIIEAPIQPVLQVTDSPHAGAEGARSQSSGFKLGVRFHSDDGEADPDEVIRAWRMGRSLVPLLAGGYAPLPADWLQEHGALLEELMAARDNEGRVHRNATAALAELMDGAEADAPADLRKLRTWLEGAEELPDMPLPDGFNAELRPYQMVGYRWLAFLRDMDLHGVLADDMGLGKTIQALAAIASTDGPSLVVAPTSVLRNWARESAKFTPNLKVNVYHGPGRTLDFNADITVTSYALLRLDLARLREITWTYAVLDEAQAIKNPDSQTARAAFKLKATHRLALTGTPIENRLEELWSLFKFLMPGLLGPRATFRDRFERPIEAGDDKAQALLRQRVKAYVLRRLKSQVATDLPALTDIVIRCEMSAAQRKVYETVRNAARRDVWLALSDQGNKRWQMQVLEALLRMRQACCDPSLLPGNVGNDAPSCKLDELEDLLVGLVVDDHKVLVFSQWTSFLDRVELRLKKLGIDWARLDGGTRDRQTVIDNFQSDGGPPVFLLSLKAGGTGLNLTAADYVVHLDPWWNPAVQQQATDRAHRIGQDKPVVSCRFVAEGTVEERILELQEAKKALADAALGEAGGFVRALNADELRSLFESA